MVLDPLVWMGVLDIELLLLDKDTKMGIRVILPVIE